jgi:hypothetical protein
MKDLVEDNKGYPKIDKRKVHQLIQLYNWRAKIPKKEKTESSQS